MTIRGFTKAISKAHFDLAGAKWLHSVLLDPAHLQSVRCSYLIAGCVHEVVVGRPSAVFLPRKGGGMLRNAAWAAPSCSLSGVLRFFLWNSCISPTPPLGLVVSFFLDVFSLRAKGWRSPLDSTARTKTTMGSWCTTRTGSSDLTRRWAAKRRWVAGLVF